MECPECGADLAVWQEMFGERHYCPPSDEGIAKVLGSLRQAGIPCFPVTDLASPELEELIRGEG